MSGDILKKKIIEIYTDYKIEFLKYYKKIKRRFLKQLKKLKYFLLKLKENILKEENRKKYLTITGILIIFNFLILNLYISYSYYHGEQSFSLINTKVGDMYLEEYDYVLLVYLENTDTSGNGNGKYHLSNNIPSIGYTYSGYKCQNNSSLIYDDSTKTTSVTTDQKELCSVYFDIIGSVDLNINVMVEDMVDSDNYILSENIPYYGYKYSHYKCENDSELIYNEELHSVKLSSTTKEYCNIYFKKESSDIEVNLYIEDNYQSGNYINRYEIPTNISYTLNDTKSFCNNVNNERIETTISYENGYINAEVNEKAICDIYLDVADE